MPRLLLDSASIDDMQDVLPTGMVGGVTTNPSLLSKSGYKGKYLDYVKDVTEYLRTLPNKGQSSWPHVSFEVLTDDPSKMEDEANKIVEAAQHAVLNDARYVLHVKIPVTFENLKVIRKLSRRGVKVNATACATALQAQAASDAGAEVVSFFYNRMMDSAATEARLSNKTTSFLALAEIEKFTAKNNTYVIAGSIRQAKDIEPCLKAGVTWVTASKKILTEALQHEVTDNAIRQFKEDSESWRS